MLFRDRSRLVVGSVGLAIALTGLLIFLGQMYQALETGRLETVAVRHVLDEPLVRGRVPTSLSEPVQRISRSLGADGAIDWLLDVFPLSLLLIIIGGVATWRSLAWERPSAHKR